MMKSALKDLMESAAKDWAECNTDGNIMLKLEDGEEEDSDMFERKLVTYEDVYMNFPLVFQCLESEAIGKVCKRNLLRLYADLQNDTKLWEALIW